MMPDEFALIGQVVSGPDQVIVDVNDAYAEMVRRDRSDLIGRHALSFTYKSDLPRNQSHLDRLSSSGPSFAIIKRYVRGDGSLSWVENHVSGLRNGSGPLLLCATCKPVMRPFGIKELVDNHALVEQFCGALLSTKELFGREIINAPVIETLLWLYRAEIEGDALTVDFLAEKIGISTNLVIRWVTLMQSHDLVEDGADGHLSALSVLRISQEAERAFDGLLSKFVAAALKANDAD